MIEKHFTDDKKNGGVDSAFSMEMNDLIKLVKDCKMVAKSLGVKGIRLQEDEYPMRAGRRSIYLVHELKKGEILSKEHVRSVRPALGLEPYLLNEVLGKKAKFDLKEKTPLKQDDFE